MCYKEVFELHLRDAQGAAQQLFNRTLYPFGIYPVSEFLHHERLSLPAYLEPLAQGRVGAAAGLHGIYYGRPVWSPTVERARQTLHHELGHLFLFQATGLASVDEIITTFGDDYLWLSEGFAEYTAELLCRKAKTCYRSASYESERKRFLRWIREHDASAPEEVLRLAARRADERSVARWELCASLL